MIKRALHSTWLHLVIIVALVAVVMFAATAGMQARVTSQGATDLANAVRRSAVQCYAVEGSFPTSVSYLEQNYGLIIDHTHYVVYYEPMGANLLPQVRVLTVNQ